MKDLLAQAAGEVAKSTGSAAALAPLWKAAVGDAVARNSRPLTLEYGVLTVEVTSQQWADALTGKEAELRARLGSELHFKRLLLKVKP